MTIKEMLVILEKAKKNLEKAPEGCIRVIHNKNSVQYYNRKKYIPKSDFLLIKQLAQKRYDKKIISVVKKQIEINKIIQKEYNPKCIEKEYEMFSPELIKLITPYAVSDNEYAIQWIQKNNSFKEKDGKYTTVNGEHVRSKSEVMIADRLYIAGIPYRYEAELQLKTENRTYTIYPDFTVLNKTTRKEIIIEHFGMMDDPDYAEKAVSKINTYSKNGYIQGKNILFTFETSIKPLDMQTVDALIKTYLT